MLMKNSVNPDQLASSEANTLYCFNPLLHRLYLENCIISINNSNFQLFSKE